MAVIFRYSLHSPFWSRLPPHSSSLYSFRPPSRGALISCPSSSSSSSSLSASSQMDPQSGGCKTFMEFPYVSTPHKDLMAELVSVLETRLDSYLLPCNLPPDVQYYQNQSGTAHASLHIRSGLKSSQIDFILGSWLHSELPSGGALNITSLSAYLNTTTDAPNFLLELIRSSPTSLVIILDLPPRKDLVLEPEYLHTFYEDTQLERLRQLLEKIPEVQPHFSSALYIRCAVSPTAILVRMDTEAGGAERLEEILQDHVTPIAKEVLGIWLDRCAFGEREVKETERACLAERDQMFRNQTIEIDLGSSFPRLFGEKVAARVLGAIQEVFNA